MRKRYLIGSLLAMQVELSPRGKREWKRQKRPEWTKQRIKQREQENAKSCFDLRIPNPERTNFTSSP